MTALVVPTQLALDLPGLTLTATSAIVDPGATAADVDAMLRSLDVLAATSNWWQGDVTLAAMQRVRAGDTAMHATQPLTDQQQAARCLRVASVFPPERRRASLSWSHHETVVGQPERHQERLLDIAVDNGLTVHALRSVMIQEAIDVRGEELPLPKPFTLPAGVVARIAELVPDDGDVRVVLARVGGTWKVER